MGSFLSRGLLMSFGYAYPAYECFKEVENNNPETQRLLFWCQYWFTVAIFTVCERVGDALISWLPMYNEAKLAFMIYLWYPRTEGASYVYGSFFKPSLVEHQAEIDHVLLELRNKAGNISVLFWHNIASYGQTRFFEILRCCSSQSSSSLPFTEKQQCMPYTVSSHEDEHSPNAPGATVSVQSAGEETSASELQKTLIDTVQSFEDVQAQPSARQETTSKKAIRSTTTRRGIWRFFHAKDS